MRNRMKEMLERHNPIAVAQVLGYMAETAILKFFGKVGEAQFEEWDGTSYMPEKVERPVATEEELEGRI